MTRSRRIARETALWVGGGLGALSLLALALGWVLHVTPLVFASGSMTPTYDVGALGVARSVPAADLHVGDVVSVIDDQGRRVTHRIVEVRHEPGRALLVLRGDANDTSDAQSYEVTSADRVAFGVPYAGYVLNAAASPYGVGVTAAAVMGLLFLGFGGSAGASARRRTRALIPAGVVSVLVVGGVAGVSGAAPWAFTSAYWTDSATATTAASVGGDSTAPVLSNPVPADSAFGPTITALACSASANQLCVSAADEAGGSGVSAVAVKLVRTSATTQCWNGSAFVNGTACSAQAMTLVSGSQYRTSGLTVAAMGVGTYQATFTATDVAGNSAAALTAGFTIGPVITGCTRSTSSGDISVSWGAVTGASSYNITSTATGTTNGVSSPRTLAVGKNSSGTVTVTAVGTTGTVSSVSWTYDGSGSNQACHS